MVWPCASGKSSVTIWAQWAQMQVRHRLLLSVSWGKAVGCNKGSEGEMSNVGEWWWGGMRMVGWGGWEWSESGNFLVIPPVGKTSMLVTSSDVLGRWQVRLEMVIWRSVNSSNTFFFFFPFRKLEIMRYVKSCNHSQCKMCKWNAKLTQQTCGRTPQ